MSSSQGSSDGGLLGLFANYLESSGLISSQGAPSGASEGEESAEPGRHRHVPPVVCANCPICQGAAAIDSLNPALFSDLATMTANLLTGIAAAMAAASERRTGGAAAGAAPRQPNPQPPAPQGDADEAPGEPADNA